MNRTAEYVLLLSAVVALLLAAGCVVAEMLEAFPPLVVAGWLVAWAMLAVGVSALIGSGPAGPRKG